jgi:hypothetical protein
VSRCPGTTNRVSGTAGSDQAADCRARCQGKEEADRFDSGVVEDGKHDATSEQGKHKSAHRPSEPGCGAVAYPTDSSALFPCPYCHNTTRSGLKVLLAYRPALRDETGYELAVALVWDAEAFPELAFFQGKLESE